ncbi:hypothetical protein SAMN06297387_10520 [Streptomyces zhaozhouensis]|uniref:DUF1963 domain-containing protein n=1 Tax=Streptomyces zhaozhouensis TaxID=1300267 RepID=A0A286DU63_9ACTN|nr:hypothetical protein [Streptomyces zhaozhouensis]SOD62205.1 hypothetical protein SAMN06297387_10520 [Streptomyces zhaozhouensis]
MRLVRTTPPRPVDVAALFPPLAPLAREATRLHPRPGSPSARDSSVGGPLLWPADEPWPHCATPHPDANEVLRQVRQERRARRDGAAGGVVWEPEAAPAEDDEDIEWPEGPVPLLPVAQLFLRDVPFPRPHGRADADLLQVLWCPFEHPETYLPGTALFWRSSADITDVLVAPPEPTRVEFDFLVPEPCVLAPERVVEYPGPMELDRELRERLADPDAWRAAGAGVDGAPASHPESFYHRQLSVAPGWKVGGWPSWGYTDPVPRLCPACGAGMDPLLTIATFEWDGDQHGWVPYEDQATASDARGARVDPRRPTAVQIGSGHRQQLYVCPVAPEHPHVELMQ